MAIAVRKQRGAEDAGETGVQHRQRLLSNRPVAPREKDSGRAALLTESPLGFPTRLIDLPLVLWAARVTALALPTLLVVGYLLWVRRRLRLVFAMSLVAAMLAFLDGHAGFLPNRRRGISAFIAAEKPTLSATPRDQKHRSLMRFGRSPQFPDASGMDATTSIGAVASPARQMALTSGRIGPRP
jgi:hypothetical protein